MVKELTDVLRHADLCTYYACTFINMWRSRSCDMVHCVKMYSYTGKLAITLNGLRISVNVTQFSTSGAVNHTLRVEYCVTEFRVGYSEMFSPLEVVNPY